MADFRGEPVSGNGWARNRRARARAISPKWSVGDPVAVKARRHPVRQMHDRLRRSGEIVGVEDDEVGRLVRHVDDEADQPAVILGALGDSGHESEFAGMAAGARSEEHTSELQSLMRISYA